MNGRFLATSPSAPCTSCGQPIRVGASVYYDSSHDDTERTGDCCVRFDLFGGVA